MNVENILKLAEVLESPAAEEHFDMSSWLDHNGDHDLPDEITYNEMIKDCGTVACIAGWATVLAKGDEIVKEENYEFGIGADYLDLEYTQAKHLFTPGVFITVDGEEVSAYAATPKQAAKVLRHLAATGEVDWDVACE